MVRWLAENFDVSRQQDEKFVYIYLHDTQHVDPELLTKFLSFKEFCGIDLRDNCICIKVLKAVFC